MSMLALAGAVTVFARAQTVSTDLSAPLPEEKSLLRVGSPEEMKSRFKGAWQAEMGFEGSDQGRDEGFAAHFGGRGRFDLQLTPIVALRAIPAVDFIPRDCKSAIKAMITKASCRRTTRILQLMPVPWFEFRAGALSQRFLDEPFLVSRRTETAFPGGQAFFHTDFNPPKRNLTSFCKKPCRLQVLNPQRFGAREPVHFSATQSRAFAYLSSCMTWNFTVWGGQLRCGAGFPQPCGVR